MHTAHYGDTFHGNDEDQIIGWADSAFKGKGKERTAADIVFSFA